MELLKKYFADQYVNGKLYTHKIDNEEEKLEVLRLVYAIVEKHGLREFSKEILQIIGIIKANWSITLDLKEIDIKKYNRMKKEIKILRSILNQEPINIHEIAFKTKNHTGKSVVENLDSYFVLKTIKKHIDFSALKDEMEEIELSMLSNDWVHKKDSFYLNFVTRTLFPFFELLKNETCLKDEPNNKIYDIIYFISIIAGVEWNHFITYSNYQEYLKDTFYKIRKSQEPDL